MNSDLAVLPGAEEREGELVALARLLAYAKETAGSLDAEVAVFCIESAIEAILQQLSSSIEGITNLKDLAYLKQASRC